MRHVINRQDRVKAQRLLAQEPSNYYEVHRGLSGQWKIVGWAKVPGDTPKDIIINDEQFRMMVFYKIIDQDLMIFEQRRFKIVNQNLKFQELYFNALDSIDKTGRLPDGKSLDNAGVSLADL